MATGSPSRRKALEWVVWGLLVAVMAGLAAIGLWRATRDGAEPPPVIATVPDFTLTDRDGSSVGLDDLRGEPWIADFIFTRCAASCLRMSAEMARLGERLPPGGGVRRVSFSVDPEHDTPEVLAAYAERFGAGEGWHFLTGEREEMHRLSIEGFLLGLDASPPPGAASPEEPILHSTRFVLVDERGRIRGYYDAFEPGEVDRLLAELRALR